MKTSVKQLAELKAAKNEAVKAYNDYLKEFNSERNIKPGHLVTEIINLYRQGHSKSEIIEAGFNKNYVNQQIRFYTKGKRMVKTTVAQFLPPKEKKK